MPRGYTSSKDGKFHYPICWLKTLNEAQCIEKAKSLGQEPDEEEFEGDAEIESSEEVVETPAAKKIIRKGDLKEFSFQVYSMDDLNITLEIGNKKTYHPTIEAVAKEIRNQLERAKIGKLTSTTEEITPITSVEELLKVCRECKEEFAKIW